ncbi:MAG: hypothetical protein ACFE9I_06040 [Candidatus Hermodarchaeota archaeon]
MAGLDRMYDTRGDIEYYIAHKIRELLEEPMNELQDPNWVQAATLFEQLILPLDIYIVEGLLNLANDIVKKAEEHNNRVVYKDISPRLYNQVVIDSPSLDINNLPVGVNIIDYNHIIDNIKKWIEHQKELKESL